MLSFKVTTVGASEGLILNKEAKRILNVQKGDTLFMTEAPDGAMRITPYSPEFADVLNMTPDRSQPCGSQLCDETLFHSYYRAWLARLQMGMERDA